ncbi:MAG: MFS transporter [Verrucomicrobia bacterium]|nr:MFS transporter [Verrucomicrobiota bacterium]
MKAGYFKTLIAPLANPVFRALWIATVFSNVGTLMHSVGAAWLMTSMTTSPLLVGLVPACIFLPTFFAGILGGVLADMVERRRILIVTQTAMMIGAATLGLITVTGHISPATLLWLTLCLGFFSALNLPAWQSQIQEMVSPGQIAAAVSLNSMSFNSARSIGPAIGGLLVAAKGPAVVFFLNAASFLGTVFVLAAWKRPPFQRQQKEVLKTLREGFDFAFFSPIMRAPLLRVSAFAFAASAIWAVLPLLARETLKTGPLGYGFLLGAFGLGSIITGGLVPGMRHRWHPDRIAAPAILLLSLSFICLGTIHRFPVALCALFTGGLAWVAVLIQFNVAVQVSVPAAMRGRALSFYLVFFQGSMGLGSAWNGWIATHVGISHALVFAGIILLLGLPLIVWFPLPRSSSTEDVLAAPPLPTVED